MRLHSEEQRRQFRKLRAAFMTRNPTAAEAKAWIYLARMGFVRQYSIETPRHRSAGATNGWILDFYHKDAKLCIEIDGSVHRKTRGRDGRRDRALAALGIRTLRFPNSLVLNHGEDFAARVAAQFPRLDA